MPALVHMDTISLDRTAVSSTDGYGSGIEGGDVAPRRLSSSTDPDLIQRAAERYQPQVCLGPAPAPMMVSTSSPSQEGRR